MVPLRVLSRINLADTSRRSALNPRSFNALQPLKVSWLSFSDSRPLFSIACSLFLQFAGGVGYPDPDFGPSAGVDEDSRCRRCNYGTTRWVYLSASAPPFACVRRMRHVAPLSLVASVDCAYFSSPRGCVPRRASDFPGAWMRSQPAFRSPLATRHSLCSAATINSMRPKTLCIALLSLLPAAAAAQTPNEVIAKVFAARGGLAKIRAINSERVSGKISFGEVTGPFVVELKRPLKMHMELTIQNQTMVRVHDGKSQGWANNPFAGKMNPDAMTEEELKNITEESDFDGPLVDYKSKGNQVELVGKDKVNDKDAWRVRLTTKNGDVRFYLFDANSFLLLKWEGKRKYEGQELPVESYFSDYREVGGLKFAFAIDSGSSAKDLTQKIRIEKIELNPELNDAEFAKPPTPPQPGAPAATPAAPPA